MKMFIVGVLIGLVLLPVAGYLYVRQGFLSLATKARPLPFEEFLAHTALRASVGSARDRTDPLPVTDENLLAGAKAYRENCALCHGLPSQLNTLISDGMFPPPPQLLEGHGMVTDDPEGTTFWKISNGIRLSGMPRFDTMPETARWQLTMLLKHADKQPPAVQAILRQPLSIPR
jgi:mono/diheme cytochrome c family protein